MLINALISILLLLKDQMEEVSSQSSRTSSPDVPDSVTLRQDPQVQNGSTQAAMQRHTLTGIRDKPITVLISNYINKNAIILEFNSN